MNGEIIKSSRGEIARRDFLFYNKNDEIPFCIFEET